MDRSILFEARAGCCGDKALLPLAPPRDTSVTGDTLLRRLLFGRWFIRCRSGRFAF